MKRLILLIFILFASSLICPAANEYLKMVQETRDDQDVVQLTVTTYISPKGYIYDWGEGGYLLFTMEESKFYVIDKENEEYFPVDNDLVKPIMDQINERMWGEDPSVTSAFTGLKDSIDGLEVEVWECEMKGQLMSLEIKVWFSSRYPLSLVAHKYYQELAKMQGERGLLTLEFLKLPGFSILMETTATAFGISAKLITKTTFISDEPLPDSLFEIPEDYEKVEADPEILMDAILQ